MSDIVKPFWIVIKSRVDPAFDSRSATRAFQVPSSCSSPYALKIYAPVVVRKTIKNDMEEMYAATIGQTEEYMRYTFTELGDNMFGVIYGQFPGTDVFSDIYTFFVVPASDAKEAIEIIEAMRLVAA